MTGFRCVFVNRCGWWLHVAFRTDKYSNSVSLKALPQADRGDGLRMCTSLDVSRNENAKPGLSFKVRLIESSQLLFALWSEIPSGCTLMPITFFCLSQNIGQVTRIVVCYVFSKLMFVGLNYPSNISLNFHNKIADTDRDLHLWCVPVQPVNRPRLTMY